jgi:hypothetical protein
MSKPIFVMRFPHQQDLDRELLQKAFRQVSESLESDYHILALIDGSVNRTEFECYNAPHTELEFEELKKSVLETINNLTK